MVVDKLTNAGSSIFQNPVLGIVGMTSKNKFFEKKEKNRLSE